MMLTRLVIHIFAATTAVVVDVAMSAVDQQKLRSLVQVPASRKEKKPSYWVVITTTNHPTQTIKALASAPQWRVVVVTDQKTPKDWQLENVDILDIKRQQTLDYKILQLLPYNHYGYAEGKFGNASTNWNIDA